MASLSDERKAIVSKYPIGRGLFSFLDRYRLSPRDAQPHLAHDFPEIPKNFKIVELHQYGGY